MDRTDVADLRRNYTRDGLAETDADKARETVTAMCEKLLANTVIESYSVEVS